MPVKRSLIGRSSSFGETGLVNQVSPSADSADPRWNRRTAPASAASKPPSSSAKIWKPSKAEVEQSRPRILTLSSPVQETDKERLDVSTEGFLEKCFYCKKKISENDEVFMYSYLRAFCTSECRDEQIAMDREVKKVSGESTATVSGHIRMSNVKDRFGSQL
ncbi:hypothetical protein L1049_003675 [Liquidambar formosana]|uniref:FLZ-type domain-containing protein n=1 Tax=Liquidambar formosana TaxID=63359 RepID=A0AAP0RSJ4_LIQFO